MDSQPKPEKVFHFQAEPRPIPKVYKLKIDLRDGRPLRYLIYTDNQNRFTVASEWLQARGVDRKYRQALANMIRQECGEQSFAEEDLWTMEKTFRAPERCSDGEMRDRNEESCPRINIKQAKQKPKLSQLKKKTEAQVQESNAWENKAACEQLKHNSQKGSDLGDTAKHLYHSGMDLGNDLKVPASYGPNDYQHDYPPLGPAAVDMDGMRQHLGDTAKRPPQSSMYYGPNDYQHDYPPLNPAAVDMDGMRQLFYEQVTRAINAEFVEPAVPKSQIARMSKSILESDLRISEVEETLKKMDVGETAFGYGERLTALEGMVTRLVKKNVRLSEQLSALGTEEPRKHYGQRIKALESKVTRLVRKNVWMSEHLNALGSEEESEEFYESFEEL